MQRLLLSFGTKPPVLAYTHTRNRGWDACAAGHTDSVEAVALSSVLPVAATASIDGKMLIWDNASLTVRGTCEHPEVSLPSSACVCCT